MDEIENMDEEMREKVEREIAKIDSYGKALLDRVAKIELIHESLVVVEKIDVRSMKSILFFVENSKFDRLKNSYYGRILKVSGVDSGEEVIENKKKIIAVGDIVSFNPDVGYSLNIIVPEEMPEIWVISVDNILTIDKAFDPVEAKKKTIVANVLIERKNAEIQREALRREEKKLRAVAVEQGRSI